mmetsp:Transcript_2549/g.7232  ORF Transcript_2549/g.7232 Transcript_2549/m.7232 type:complete len:161 (-) Transcript_2549:120-602(-)
MHSCTLSCNVSVRPVARSAVAGPARRPAANGLALHGAQRVALSSRRRCGCRHQACVCAAAAAETEKNSDINTMKPLGNRLLIKPEELEPVTSGGVILPTDVAIEEDSKLGTVVAIGEDVSLDVTPGQMVLFDSKSQVTEIPTGEFSVMFVAQPSIHAVLS